MWGNADGRVDRVGNGLAEKIVAKMVGLEVLGLYRFDNLDCRILCTSNLQGNVIISRRRTVFAHRCVSPDLQELYDCSKFASNSQVDSVLKRPSFLLKRLQIEDGDFMNPFTFFTSSSLVSLSISCGRNPTYYLFDQDWFTFLSQARQLEAPRRFRA